MPAAQRSEGITVLIIEDHDESRSALRQFLEHLGVKVLEARDGEDGLRILRTVEPDVIFCDLTMPGMDGFAFIARLRNDPKLSRLRVIALTGRGSDQDLLKTWEAGFDGHLVKPIEDETIILGELARVLWTRPR